MGFQELSVVFIVAVPAAIAGLVIRALLASIAANREATEYYRRQNSRARAEATRSDQV